jgi:hypothetical protein
VPEAICNYFLDLVVAGAIVEDWIKLFGQVFATMYVNPSALAGKKPPAHPKPARPDAFYAGTYDNEYYGPIRIVNKGSSLHLLIGPHPFDYPLKHWDGNLFAFFPTGENALGITAATFIPDQANDRAASVTRTTTLPDSGPSLLSDRRRPGEPQRFPLGHGATSAPETMLRECCLGVEGRRAVRRFAAVVGFVARV